MERAIEQIRAATLGTPFEGRVYVVGGMLRDQVLGLPADDDLDLVVEGDALELAALLHRAGIASHRPVLYPRFRTAMLTVSGTRVELASARAETYDPATRKPAVRPATLREDALRRDFTINTLLKRIHGGEMLDPTGLALQDLQAGLIRTPLNPEETFRDDPLRMLRAARFAARFGFTIEPRTSEAMKALAYRLSLFVGDRPVVSAERIRDELERMIVHPGASRGLRILMEADLLAQFLPELSAMKGVEQNAWHIHDVWDHTLAALDALPSDAPLILRLGVLLHDVGKPVTRTEDEKGIHFFGHAAVGAEMTREILYRLRFSTDVIRAVSDLVRLHMRVGEYKPNWTDGAVRRLIRDTQPYLEMLIALARADIAAMSPDAPVVDLDELRKRMDHVNAQMDAARIRSPLSGAEIMRILDIRSGPEVGLAKQFLLNEVLDGRLDPGDAESATKALTAWWNAREAEQAPANAL